MPTYYTFDEDLVLGKMVHIINIGSEKSHLMTFDHTGTYVGSQSGSVSAQAWGKVRGTPEERARKLAQNFKAITDSKKWAQEWKDDYDQTVDKLFYLTGGAAEVARQAFSAYYPEIKVVPNPLYSDCEGVLQIALQKWRG